MGDLSVTALYTSQVWRAQGLSQADLFDLPEGRAAFRTVNAALALARLVVPGRPSLLHSLAQRHAMIDHLVASTGARAVLELACGLSRRGAAVAVDPTIAYTEVDLPAVIAAKRRLLDRTAEGRAVAARPNLRLVGGDVLDGELTRFADPRPDLLVIAEGLVVYLDGAARLELWRKVAALLVSGGTFVFDLVPPAERPPRPAVARLLGWLMRRFTGGRGFARDDSSRADIVNELRDAGLESVEVIEPRDVMSTWGLPHPDRRTQEVLFVCRSRGGRPSP
jgi:O-methyltransferase involved in polyketide biosynthesis